MGINSQNNSRSNSQWNLTTKIISTVYYYKLNASKINWNIKNTWILLTCILFSDILLNPLCNYTIFTSIIQIQSNKADIYSVLRYKFQMSYRSTCAGLSSLEYWSDK